MRLLVYLGLLLAVCALGFAEGQLVARCAPVWVRGSILVVVVAALMLGALSFFRAVHSAPLSRGEKIGIVAVADVAVVSAWLVTWAVFGTHSAPLAWLWTAAVLAWCNSLAFRQPRVSGARRSI